MLIAIVTDNAAKARALYDAFPPAFETECIVLGSGHKPSRQSDAIVIDVDLSDVSRINQIRLTLKGVAKTKHRLFLAERRVRRLQAQAYALGATCVLFKPINAVRLREQLGRLFAASGGHGTASLVKPQDVVVAGIDEGASSLESMFTAVRDRQIISVSDARRSTRAIIESIDAKGLTRWLDDVRNYHEGTFQHCLLVTGLAVDFSLSLRFPEVEVERVGLAAALHDIGKSAIPVEILDKPGRLNDDERRMIESHPVIGYDALRSTPDLPAEVLDAVLHHHEYLDGSGYPDGISGAQIFDMTRVLTISDIFAALVEQRSYKVPMPRGQAYQILVGMEGKLEMSLVKAFRATALTR